MHSPRNSRLDGGALADACASEVVQVAGVSHGLLLEALRGTHNAAPAEYPGCAALAYALGNKSEIPSADQWPGLPRFLSRREIKAQCEVAPIGAGGEG